MKTIKHIMYLLAAGCLVFCMSCSNDDTDTSSQQKNIAFTQAESALADGVGGFTVTLKSGETTLYLQLVGEETAGATLETGTYDVTRKKNIEYSVRGDDDGSYWTEATNGAKHVVNGGHVSVVNTDAGSTLSGTLTDRDGETLRFSSEALTFSLTQATDVTYTKVLSQSYTVQSGFGSYCVVLATADQKQAVLLYFYNEKDANYEVPELPAGRYKGASSGMVGHILMNTASYWLDASSDKNHYMQSISCSVEYVSGEAVINGVMTDKDGQSVRFTFRGKLEFGRYRQIDRAFYEKTSGEWTMNADKWWVYTRKTKTWGEDDAPSSRTKRVTQWVGVPDYGKFYVSGLFDAKASGMFVNVNGTELSITTGYKANPMFIAMSGSYSYYIFPVLYDPETGYFMTTGTIKLTASEDGNTLQVEGATAKVKDSDTGEEVEAHYNYFGVLGSNLTTGGLTRFSNWSYAYLPTFNHTVVTDETETSSTTSRSRSAETNAFIPMNSISGVVPMQHVNIKDIDMVEAEKVIPINR